ncbi:MAG: hypothetical protein Ct9H90mP16_01700 [Candidatus Poseidoniales archaeon]|nr:MAG: hypothetical protein Ct9H90mP16_01700 [Candidatus Poseidoniales archaeon]
MLSQLMKDQDNVLSWLNDPAQNFQRGMSLTQNLARVYSISLLNPHETIPTRVYFVHRGAYAAYSKEPPRLGQHLG